MILVVEQVTGQIANVVYADRRAGDPARLIASSEKILVGKLNWSWKRLLGVRGSGIR